MPTTTEAFCQQCTTSSKRSGVRASAGRCALSASPSSHATAVSHSHATSVQGESPSCPPDCSQQLTLHFPNLKLDVQMQWSAADMHTHTHTEELHARSSSACRQPAQLHGIRQQPRRTQATLEEPAAIESCSCNQVQSEYCRTDAAAHQPTCSPFCDHLSRAALSKAACKQWPGAPPGRCSALPAACWLAGAAPSCMLPPTR